MKSLILLVSALFFVSCSAQEDVQIKLTIHNKSGKTLDSLLVYDVFSKQTMFYKITKDTIITKNYVGKKSSLPKGESGVFTLVGFEKNLFYSATAGFIGFPTARLEDEYDFYIYDTYIATKEGYIPPDKHPDQRQKLEDFIR